MVLRSTLALPSIVAALCVMQAVAQPSERLVRRSAADVASLGQEERAETVLKESIFSMYVTVGSAAANPATDKQVIATSVKEKICGGPAGIYAEEVIKLEVAHAPQGSEVQARLKAYDGRTTTLMSIVVLETLEDVSRQAIVADEKIGPGVYHRAIEGLNFIQGACGFQGDESASALPSQSPPP